MGADNSNDQTQIGSALCAACEEPARPAAERCSFLGISFFPKPWRCALKAQWGHAVVFRNQLSHAPGTHSYQVDQMPPSTLIRQRVQAGWGAPPNRSFRDTNPRASGETQATICMSLKTSNYKLSATLLRQKRQLLNQAKRRARMIITACKTMIKT